MSQEMKRYIILCLTVCCVVSCDLTTVPEDSTVPESYFKNLAAHEQWLNNCYSQFDDISLYLMEGDDVVDKMPTEFFGRTLLPSTHSWSWTMLRHINYYLEHADLCPDTEGVKYYKALARFHRAWFYCRMVMKYGDIMWYDQVIGSTDEDLLYKKRDDRGFVVRKIIEDLDAAAEGLAGTPKNELSTNITQWTALALKSRICLFEGTFRKYRGMEEWKYFLEESVKASEAIIDSKQFSLYKEGDTPYRDAFFSTTYPACECILARAYSSALSMNHTLDRDIPGAGTGFTQRFVNHYLMKSDGSYFSAVPGYDKLQFKDVFNNRDPRMIQTIWGPGATDGQGNAGVDAFNLRSITGYFPLKLMRDIGRTTAMNINVVLFRYPEILVNYAEAMAELGLKSDEDIKKVENAINTIRDRVGMPHFDYAQANSNPDALLASYYPNVKTVNPSDYGAIFEIRRERTVELVMEGHRQWDIIRWAIGASIDNQKNPFYGAYFPGPGLYDLSGDGQPDVELYETGKKQGGTAHEFEIGVDVFLSEGTKGNLVALKALTYIFNEERDYLWPIPASQRELSRGNLSQNPGWVDGVDF